MDYDIYLNLFVPYSQRKNDDPKENNLSRGIAILLEENYLFFDRFIDFINVELSKNNHAPVAKPSSITERAIDIQNSASNLAVSSVPEGVQRIIPVTLTPEKTEFGEEARDTENPIPDISILCNNDESSDLIIIEVKQYQANADAQVLNQVESIQNKMKENDDIDVSVVKDVIRITWQDIIQIIQNVKHLQEGRSDFVLEHYLDYLKYYRQRWFPIEPFRAGMTDEMVLKRVWPLANNCARLLNPDEEVSGQTTWIPLSWGYALGAYVYHNSNGIDVVLWPGNIGKQSWPLFRDNGQIRNDMSWINVKTLKIDEDVELGINTRFNLNLSQLLGPGTKTVFGVHLSSDVIGTDRAEICKNFCNVLNGKWPREGEWGWEKLKDFLLVKNPGLVEEPEEFEKDFNEKFEQSNRSVLAATLGYEIKINLPMKLLEELDKRNGGFMNAPENDAVAKVIVSALNKLKNMIEE